MTNPHKQPPGLEVVPQAHLEVASHELNSHTQHLPEVRPDEFDHGLKEAVSASTYPYPFPHPASAYPAGLEHISYVDGNGHRNGGGGNGGYDVLPGGYSPSGRVEIGADNNSLKRGKRKRWLVIGGVVVVVVVILAAVLGGVFGSRAANSSSSESTSTDSSSSDSNDPSASSTPSATPKTIRAGSALAVTGWRRPDGNTETYLFFQDPQDGLRYMRCDSGKRKPGNESACWEPPVRVKSYAKAGTHLAASTIVWGEEYHPQIELFYAGFQTRLLGLSVHPDDFSQSAANSTDDDDTINAAQLYTAPDSSLASYWPWTLYHYPDGSLYHARNQLLGFFEPATAWDHNPTNITSARARSRLAVVPTSTNFSMAAVKAGYAVFYQEGVTGRLAVGITDLQSNARPGRFVQPWPVNLPDIILAGGGDENENEGETQGDGAAMAAFSVARAGDPRQRVDTYVVYRDGQGKTGVLFSDPTPTSPLADANADAEENGGSAVWRTLQPDALQNVDKDSDIACLTLATWVSSEDGVATLLEPATGENRCFFQRGGQVQELKLDAGTGEWVGVGVVPVP